MVAARSPIVLSPSRRGAGEAWRRAKRLAFPAALAPLQIFLFGAYTIYAGNTDELRAPFWRLAVHWLPLFAVLVAGLIGLGLLLPAGWLRRYVVALFGLGVLTWLQGGILAADYGPLTGKALDWELHAGRSPYEIGLWVIGLTAMIAASRRLVAIAPFASLLLVGLQTVVLAGSALRSGAPATAFSEPSEFVFELSRTRNVIHVVLDAFQGDVFGEIVDGDPAAAEALSGFVFFADHAGAFPTTIASIPAMLTGEVYRNQEPVQRFVRRLAAERWLFGVLRKRGFDTDAVSMHAQGLASATNAYVIPRPYVGRGEYARFASWQLVDLSLFRHAPHVLKRWIHNDQGWRLQTLWGVTAGGAATRRRFHSDNGRAFLEDFVRRVHVGRERPVYKLLHVGVPHLPLVLDARCEFIGLTALTRDGYRDQAACAVDLVRRLLDRLRALGVYDDSVIVLSSDHGSHLPPAGFGADDAGLFADLPEIAGAARALLAVKAAHARGPLRISAAPTTITDIPATVMDLLGFADGGYSGEPALRLAEDEPRERTFAWYEWENADWKRAYLRRMDLFAIDGPVGDGRSWSYRGAIFEPGADLEAISEGWGAPGRDRDGRRVRPLAEAAVLYAPPGSRAMRLELRPAAPLPRPVTVTVSVNGEVVDHLTLDDPAWRTVEYPLPPSPAAAAARIDLRLEPPAHPGAAAQPAPAVIARDVEWRP